MTEDPIVAEVRAVREQLFKECDCSLEKLVAYLHRQRKLLGLKVVRLPPQRLDINLGEYTTEPEKRLGKVSGSDSEGRLIATASTHKRKAN
jgi:hypothetical protein